MVSNNEGKMLSLLQVRRAKIFLTFGAVVSSLGVIGVSLPSVQANLVAVGITSVVSKLVISGPAQSVTIFAVVVIGTLDTVLVFQLGIEFLVHSVSPV